MDANLDVADVSRRYFENFGVDAAPSKLLSLTPLELFALFASTPDETDSLDRVAALSKHNHAVRAPRGLQPSVSDWLMKDVPRWQPPTKPSSRS